MYLITVSYYVCVYIMPSDVLLELYYAAAYFVYFP